MDIQHLRNIAIIAHVDHGKTTLIDRLLQQTHMLAGRSLGKERIMDSNELEQERGITILSKNTNIEWQGYRINIVDTPGHADFGGEVERILSMVDSVLLLVDAVDGPMPQTRFVTQKAFQHGLNPIVVVNKIDREGARPDWVVDQVFDLFDHLGANDTQLDFPIVYASALQGHAALDLKHPTSDMAPLLQTIIDRVSPPEVSVEGPFQMQVSSLDYSSYVGAIAIGRISRGTVVPNMNIRIIDRNNEVRSAKILQVLGYHGLERQEVPRASAGDIIAVTGIERPLISDTLCDPDAVSPLPSLAVDEPTVVMTFQVNTSPFAGREGKFLTSRQIKARLEQELIHNVALRVESSDDPDKFRVSGRGELHLAILIETMRREGYELAVSRPEVIIKEEGGQRLEPYEQLTVELDEQYQGTVMETLAERRGQLQNMQIDGKGRVRIDYIIPTRGLIGLHTTYLTITAGTGLIYHVFDHYGPYLDEEFGYRHQGVLIANSPGVATAYALWNLQQRGRMFIKPNTDVYEGMIAGIHTRNNDLVVNVIKTKQLTNIRAAGSDENIILVPPVKLTLEQALEWINDDELVEITPKSLRLRKKLLKEHERKRA